MRLHRFARLAGLVALLGLAAEPAWAGSRVYLSVGTSLSVGIQPNKAGNNRRTQAGYADQLYAALAQSMPDLQLVKLGCPGETSVTMIAGGICTYSLASQLQQAEKFLQDHGASVALVTIDVGANDIEPCGSLSGIDQTCVAGAFANVATNLPTILGRLRAAAAPGVPIVGMNYYNPFVAAWFVDPSLAQASATGLLLFNSLLQGLYGGFSVPVADVAGTFFSSDFTLVPGAGIPHNVLVVCQWTWMCAAPPVGPNIHANGEGYGAIAGAFLDTLGP